MRNVPFVCNLPRTKYSIGGLKQISRDTVNNAEMFNCWWTNKKEPMRDLLFSSANMAARRNVKTTYYLLFSASLISSPPRYFHLLTEGPYLHIFSFVEGSVRR